CLLARGDPAGAGVRTVCHLERSRPGVRHPERSRPARECFVTLSEAAEGGEVEGSPSGELGCSPCLCPPFINRGTRQNYSASRGWGRGVDRITIEVRGGPSGAPTDDR